MLLPGDTGGDLFQVSQGIYKGQKVLKSFL